MWLVMSNFGMQIYQLIYQTTISTQLLLLQVFYPEANAITQQQVVLCCVPHVPGRTGFGILHHDLEHIPVFASTKATECCLHHHASAN
jgi:hypothetical protein